MEEEIMKELQQDEGSKAIGLKVTDLPTIILSEILCKLPFNGILRCRFTCKTFRTVTMDPHFNNSQIARSKQSPGFLLGITNSEALYLTIPNTSSITKIVQLPISDSVVASCNGLLIGTTAQKGLFVLNPITNEYLELSSYVGPLEKYPHNLQPGFAFDQVHKKYKVVLVYSVWQGSITKVKCKILTLGECSWRELGFPSRINNGDKPVFLNGAFHWLILERDLHYSDFDNILALDITTETFQTTGFPSYPQGLLDISKEEYQSTKYSMSTKLNPYFRYNFKLVNFHGSLAIVSAVKSPVSRFTVDQINTPLMEIWQIMNDNQNNDRCLYKQRFDWLLIRNFVIGPEALEMLSDGMFLIWANRYIEKDELFPFLALYDPKTEVRDIIDLRGVPALRSAISFVPSLLSPRAL